MSVPLLLLLLGGFLIGGAWSVWRLERGDRQARSTPQVVLAAVLLVAALLATASGILRLG